MIGTGGYEDIRHARGELNRWREKKRFSSLLKCGGTGDGGEGGDIVAVNDDQSIFIDLCWKRYQTVTR